LARQNIFEIHLLSTLGVLYFGTMEATEEIERLKWTLAVKISVSVESGDLERAEKLSRILGNLLDKAAE